MRTRSEEPRSARRLAAGVVAILMLSGYPCRIGAADAPPAVRFRLAVSESIIGNDVNGRDANLAMMAWRDTMVRESGLLVDFGVASLPQLVQAVRERRVDGFTLTTPEYLEVESYASPVLMVDERNARGGDDYLLLVHASSGIRTLADLRGKSVSTYDNPRMCLAPAWLETLLAGANLGAPQSFFGRLAVFNKLSRVVLPVFFRQVDACVVTRQGFNTMCELNPQLGSQLHVLANSPKLVTSLMAFHKDFAPGQRQKLATALSGLDKTAAGQQALTLFESSHLVTADSSLLQGTVELIQAHERLRLKGAAARK